MDEVREYFSTKNDGDRTALIISLACLNYIIFYLSLPLCGQLGSINLSVLFMLTSNLSLSLSLLTPVSLRRIHLHLFL